MSYIADDARYDHMSYRRVGHSGLVLPEISLGLWQNFGTSHSAQEQRAIVHRAFDRGILHFDLANNYGPPPGSAEINFGKILASDLASYRDELIVSTKAGWPMWPGPYGDLGSRKYLIASLDQSLTRLGLDYVDIYYSHRPDPDTPIEETMGALASVVRKGKALYVGISAYNPEQTQSAAAALQYEGVPLAIHQPRYSMFDRHIEESGLFDTLEELQTASIVFSPLAQGLLTDRYLNGSVPTTSRAAVNGSLSESAITEDYLARARALSAIAADRGQTLAQLALTWVLRQPRVASALIGASSVEQLDQNLAALDAPALTHSELALIEPHTARGVVLG